jgi:glycerophosphoryl diester phosphodiesterase
MNKLLLFYLIVLPTCGISQGADQKRIIIAHRGDHTNAPENTLKAITEAIANQLDYVEVDLRTTKDNQLVIMHDKSIDRMTNGEGNLNDLSWSMLSHYKVIDKKRPQLGEHKIPLFAEVLDMCKGKIKIYLDFKEADVKATWELICTMGMENSFVVYINHLDQYQDWRAIAPQVPLMVSLPDSVNSVGSLKNFLQEVDAEVLDGDCKNYSPEMVQLALVNHRQVWLDFQQYDEGPEQWRKGIFLGIQGFQTDRPKELKKWLATQSKN